MQKTIFTLMAVFFLSACGPDEADFKAQVPEKPSLESRIAEAQQTKEAPIQIPEQVNIKVPFFSQAPEGDWSQPWQDACEEASLVLAHYGMRNESLTKEAFKKHVLAMVDWENQNFGYFESTTVHQVKELYKAYFDEEAFEVKIMYQPTVEDLKKELAQGHLIVAPFAGRELKNPFYSGGGPYYHMMVIKGYDQKHFITNDVGTRRGENFIYPYDVILETMHDYKEPGIETQPARVIVLYEK